MKIGEVRGGVTDKKYIYQYKCGCSDGPKPASKMLEYCGKHGADLKVKYPVLKGQK